MNGFLTETVFFRWSCWQKKRKIKFHSPQLVDKSNTEHLIRELTQMKPLCFRSPVWFSLFDTFYPASKVFDSRERPVPLWSLKKRYPQPLSGPHTQKQTSGKPSPVSRHPCHWPCPPSVSSRQPLRQWSSLPKAPWDWSSSYSWSRKSRLLLLGNPRMLNLWDTLVHCSRFAATVSYSSVAPGKSSDNSLGAEKRRVSS